MALPPHFLDELRVRTPLAPLIGRATRLEKAGRQWKACCPFHGEKSPSFYIYDDHFHCFGCGAHGDAITFVMRQSGATFMEAIERLASEAGLEVPKQSPEHAARERRAKDIHGVLAAAEAAFTRRLHLPEGREALAYLRKRRLTDETIAHFGLGWSGEGRGALASDLRDQGVEPRQLVEAGLMQERDRGPVDLFFNRVMFPIRDKRGRTISFGGRILGDGQPKYVNGPETAVFSKRRNLYGIDLAREAVFRGARLVAVEGYMDVISLHQGGFEGAVAPLGTALTPEQLEAMWAISPEPVLCLDGDSAGLRAMARAAEVALPLLSPARTLRFAILPAGEDPDTLVAGKGPDAFNAVLDAAKPMDEALFDLLRPQGKLDRPEQRAAFRNKLVEAVAQIPDKSLASEYRRSMLDRFFAMGKRAPGGKPAPVAIQRPVPGASVRMAQARTLLACLVNHPWLLQEVEEPLMLLELPEGEATQLRGALLAYLSEGGELDPEPLADHLRALGAQDALSWARRTPALPLGARKEAQPAETLECFWHFFARLRGDGPLREDLEAAQQAATRAPSAETQRRVTLLKEALDAFGRGETGSGGPEA
ncbi:DNA primase [Rhodovarius crocodyli]|uniref:DNA primase n=1 Tax=Rhodovarius crocodyli TaxID=1979269 RepID=A0A437MM81_9PROT|nr:DNA primase [Rhodovarius crocodyli]RVT98716.1 DNA primase [Rhodovarius crocodyli]